jgi:Fic family protein
MRSFHQLDRIIGRVPAGVVNQLRAIDTGRGSEALYRDQLPGLLETLSRRARVASVTASSEIEGVVVPDQLRAERIIAGRVTVLRTRNEQELAGYRDALDYLFRNDWGPLNVGLLLHLHRLLFGQVDAGGGRFKANDNLVVDRMPDGSTSIRFRPVPAAQTGYAVSELVERYRQAIAADEHHPVLLVGLFVLDLTIIHPFEDGNGRVARAVTNALLSEVGHGVVRYVSQEQLIADSADGYYQALLDSTSGWHDDRSDPWPWLSYFTGLLVRSYQLFASRAAAERTGPTKQERVRDHIHRHAPVIFRMSDIRTALPGISDQTIRLVLDGLRRDGLVTVDGVGRAAVWQRTSPPR